MSKSTDATTSDRPVELTEKNIKKAQPGDVLKHPTIKGLSLRCFPENKVFYLYFKTKTGVERRPSLGRWGNITLAQAVTAAGDMLTIVAAGRDPIAERKAEKDAPTMADLWKRYREDRGTKKKTEAEDEPMWKKYLTRFHDMKVADVTYEDVAKFFVAFPDPLAKRPGHIQANRCVALLSTLFSFAIAPLRWTTINPTEGIQMYPEKKRKRYMKGSEALEIGKLMFAESERNAPSVAFIWLMILTGARKGEIAKARWCDLKDNKLVLSEHKTDQDGEDRIISLGPEAMDVINKLPKTYGTITGILDPKKLWWKIREDAGCPDLRMHDLRHSFASEALARGYTLAQSGELLGHHSEATTKRYAHLIDEAATLAAAKIGGSIMTKMGGTSSQSA